VEPSLAIEIRPQVVARSGIKTHVCLEDVVVLSCISPTPRQSLVYQVYGDSIGSKQIIKALRGVNGDLLACLCSTDGVFDVLAEPAGNVLFLSEAECSRALHVAFGNVSYGWIANDASGDVFLSRSTSALLGELLRPLQGWRPVGGH